MSMGAGIGPDVAWTWNEDRTLERGERARYRNRRQLLTHRVAFWVVASAFLLNMAFSAVPTPLYVLYQHRDHFSGVTATVVYAVYAAGVIASLFLVGHVSDWVGRRRVLVGALLINVASAVLFVFLPSLAGLIAARVVCGVAVGMTTATATAYLAELHLGAHPDASTKRPQVIAIAANLGGIGLRAAARGNARAVRARSAAPFVRRRRRGVGRPGAADRLRARNGGRPGRTAGVASPARGRATRGSTSILRGDVGGFRRLRRLRRLQLAGAELLLGTLHQSSHALAGAVAFSAFSSGALAQIALGRLGTIRDAPVEPARPARRIGDLYGGDVGVESGGLHPRRYGDRRRGGSGVSRCARRGR